jgi:hypothetical protein
MVCCPDSLGLVDVSVQEQSEVPKPQEKLRVLRVDNYNDAYFLPKSLEPHNMVLQ